MDPDDADRTLLDLHQTLASDPTNPTHHLALGCYLWSKGEKDKSVESFVTAAKLNPGDGAAFRFLGRYHGEVVSDSGRAAKCYRRAVGLDPDDAEAGEGLCDLLDGEGKVSLEVVVCKEASERSPKAFWAFRRLGYLQVSQEKWSEGVRSLQHAIRGYPTCSDMWEALGLAYHRLGMFTAALKSYGRAVELDSSKVFAVIESGFILLMLGSFRKGVEQFRIALQLSPHNLSACFGLASGLLGLSRESVNCGAFSWGASLLQEATSVAKACTELLGNVSATWKLCGDIQMAYARCFPWFKESICSEVDGTIFKRTIKHWKATCLSSAVNSKLSYERALHLTPWQANIYADVAIASDLVTSLEEGKAKGHDIWNLPERMSLGGLILEGDNSDIWMVLGCLSGNTALKQHAFIRGLQLDVSLAAIWAHLGKLYGKLGNKKLAKQAFDHARSIDPSLALPWAGMSLDRHTGANTREQAYESCLRAVQASPFANFQVGLGVLASFCGHLSSPLVFAAVKQAVQRLPFWPESHNLDGLVSEAQLDFQSAIAAYRHAKCAFGNVLTLDSKKNVADVSFNLARALFQAGHMQDAARECEGLKIQDLLDQKGHQIYAAALFQLGKNELALLEVRHLASKVSTLDNSSRDAALGFLCKLLYRIKGLESTVATIVKFPEEFHRSSKISFVIYAMNALGRSGQLRSLVSGEYITRMSHEDAIEMHYLVALTKMLANVETQDALNFEIGIGHLKKALHMYPDSSRIRNQLGSLLLSSNNWMACHLANRCLVIDNKFSLPRDSKAAYEIIGSAAVACHACFTTKKKFSFPTCKDQYPSGMSGLNKLQKWLHQEPWNFKAHYFLVLNMMQKVREERFPEHLCVAVKRLISTALSKETQTQCYEYEKFLLWLCFSEICLQCGDSLNSLNHATNASKLTVSSNVLFFAHLQICRVYVILENWEGLSQEYMNCLRIKTDHEIGWVSLKYLDYKYKLTERFKGLDWNLEQLPLDKHSRNMWKAIFDLVVFQSCIWNMDLVNAEEAIRRANTIGFVDRCLLLCHGAICMELARQQYDMQFLSQAKRCLIKAQKGKLGPLPIVSALLAQAEGSLGSKSLWEKNLRPEWFNWPPEIRPAEVYFQMHLLANQSGAGQTSQAKIESSQSPVRWVLRSIHLNPSCSRYWDILQRLTALC